jgi:putative hydrolase of the HAD superfamily
VLTNDLRAFHGDEWVDGLEITASIDVLVDGSVEKVLKPDPRIYDLVCERMGIPPTACLFVDDQARNVAGAEAVGMRALWFDVTDPVGSYARVRAVLDGGTHD